MKSNALTISPPSLNRTAAIFVKRAISGLFQIFRGDLHNVCGNRDFLQKAAIFHVKWPPNLENGNWIIKTDYTVFRSNHGLPFYF